MNKSMVFNHYSHMLDTLIDNSLFFQYYFQSPFCLDEDIQHPCYDLDWYIHFGATRVCLEDRAYDYVVKIDLFDSEACEKEMDVYAAAVQEGMTQYFVEPTYLGTYTRTINFYDSQAIELNMPDFYDYDEEWFEDKFADNEDSFGELQPITIALPLYAYKRIVPFNFNPTYNLLAEEEQSELEIAARKVKSPLRERNLAVAIEFVKEYGEEEYKRFTEFLKDWEVNDLHVGNVALYENHLTLCDYAGYEGMCYSYDSSY